MSPDLSLFGSCWYLIGYPWFRVSVCVDKKNEYMYVSLLLFYKDGMCIIYLAIQWHMKYLNKRCFFFPFTVITIWAANMSFNRTLTPYQHSSAADTLPSSPAEEKYFFFILIGIFFSFACRSFSWQNAMATCCSTRQELRWPMLVVKANW